MEPLNAIGDLLLLITNLVAELWMNGRQELFIAAAVGSVLGALTWWLAHFVAVNFNRQFSFHAKHHIYCGIAAAFTLFFTVLFFALRYTADVAEILVAKWEISIQTDSQWRNDTFRTAYEAVFGLKDAADRPLEDFTGFPHPNTGLGTRIPLNKERSKITVVEIYADSAVEHFRTHHPTLRMILWARTGLTPEAILADMNRVFGSGRDVYPMEDAVRLAGRGIRQGLDGQLPRIVVLSRTFLVIAFLLVQGITFLLLIRAALADIREKHASQSSTGF